MAKPEKTRAKDRTKAQALVERIYFAPNGNQQLLRKIGLKIHRELYEKEKPVEWLAFETGLARSTLREIIAGRSNPRVLSLHSIVVALGYKGLESFFGEI